MAATGGRLTGPTRLRTHGSTSSAHSSVLLHRSHSSSVVPPMISARCVSLSLAAPSSATATPLRSADERLTFFPTLNTVSSTPTVFARVRRTSYVHDGCRLGQRGEQGARAGISTTRPGPTPTSDLHPRHREGMGPSSLTCESGTYPFVQKRSTFLRSIRYGRLRRGVINACARVSIHGRSGLAMSEG